MNRHTFKRASSAALGFLFFFVVACTFPASSASALEGTSTRISAKDRNGIVSAVCQGRVTNISACRRCPSFAGEQDGFDGIKVTDFHLGAFTVKGANEAYVSLNGCDGNPANFGGGVLLRKAGLNWKVTRYDSGLQPSRCLKFTYETGTVLLVCNSFAMGQGYLEDSVYAQYIGPKKTAIRNIFRAESNTETCDKNISEIELTEWRAVDVNEDGRKDLELTVTERRGRTGICGETQEFGSRNTHRLVFRFDGQMFSILPIEGVLFECLDANSSGHNSNDPTYC